MVVKKKTSWNWKISLSALLIGSIVGAVVYLVVDRHRPHEYVCHIEGYDNESNMIGMKCIYR